MMKRIISLLLSVAICMSFAPLTLAANEDYGTNIALGLDVYCDTPYATGYTPDKLTDGNVSSTCASASGGTTSMDVRNGYKNYFLVDLGGLFEISRVILSTRRDIDYAWARQGASVSIATQADFSDARMVGSILTDFGYGKDLNVNVQGSVARYIIVHHSNGSQVAVGELQVFGEPYTGKGNGEFTDVTTEFVKNAVKLLYNLEIVDGISKTEFGVDNLITRGEAAMMICKLAGIAEPGAYSGGFADVTSEHEYAPYIGACLDYGFISHDAYFRPDDYIMGYEFLKMVLCVNGHYEKTSLETLYPSKIISVANKLDLLKNSGSDGWNLMGKGSAAIVMYNALISNCFRYENRMFKETEESLLESVFGYELREGILTANGVSGLDVAQDTVNIDSVEISGNSYKDESGLGINFLGERVYYLLDKNENSVRTLWPNEKKNKTVTFDSEDVDDETTITNIHVYDENDKIIRYKVDEHAYTIVNDVAVGGIDVSELAAENSYVKLLDNNNDGCYEIIKLYRPEIMLVDSVLHDEYARSLALIDKQGDKKVYNYEYAQIKDAKGKTTSFDKIEAGSFIYVYASEDGKVVNVQKMPNGIEAVVGAKNSESIKLDGVAYKMSAYFKRVCYPTLEVGKAAVFYTDIEGRLVYVSEQATKGTTEILAVLQKFYVDANTGETDVRAYTEDKTFATYLIADEIIFNGSKYGREELATIPREHFEGKLAYIKTQSDGAIRSIITQDDEEGVLAEAEVDLSDTYRGDVGFFKGHELVLPIKENVPVFTVPVNANGIPHTSANYTSLYSVAELSNFVKLRNTLNSNDYKLYGLNEFNEPTAVVRSVVYNDNTTNYAPISSYLQISSMIVESVRSNVDEYGESYYTIIGYDIVSGKKTSITLNSGLKYAVDAAGMHRDGLNSGTTYMTSVKEIKQNMIPPEYIVDISSIRNGDIIRYSKGNYDTYSQLEIILCKTDVTVENCGVAYSAGDLPDTIMATMRLQYAMVDSVKEGRLSYRYNQIKTESLNLSGFGGSLIVCENGKTETYPISSAGVVLDENDDIAIYTNAGYHISIIAWK